MLGTGAEISAEIAPQDAAGLRIEAPEQVSMGSRFALTVTADADTIGVQLVDAQGENLPVYDLAISRTESISRWEFQTTLQSEGRKTIQATRKTWSGWEKPSAKATVLVVQAEPEILSFSPVNEVVRAGQTVTFAAVVNTNDMELVLADEQGQPIPAKVVQKHFHTDGTVELLLEAVFETSEIGKIVALKAGLRRVRTAISVL